MFEKFSWYAGRLKKVLHKIDVVAGDELQAILEERRRDDRGRRATETGEDRGRPAKETAAADATAPKKRPGNLGTTAKESFDLGYANAKAGRWDDAYLCAEEAMTLELGEQGCTPRTIAFFLICSEQMGRGSNPVGNPGAALAEAYGPVFLAEMRLRRNELREALPFPEAKVSGEPGVSPGPGGAPGAKASTTAPVKAAAPTYVPFLTQMIDPSDGVPSFLGTKATVVARNFEEAFHVGLRPPRTGSLARFESIRRALTQDVEKRAPSDSNSPALQRQHDALIRLELLIAARDVLSEIVASASTEAVITADGSVALMLGGFGPPDATLATQFLAAGVRLPEGYRGPVNVTFLPPGPPPDSPFRVKGHVLGLVDIALPAQDDDSLQFRFFPEPILVTPAVRLHVMPKEARLFGALVGTGGTPIESPFVPGTPSRPGKDA